MDNNNDEISIQQIFAILKSYLSFVWQKKIWILLAAIAFGSLRGYNESKKETTYEGELTFMINNDESGGLGGLSAVLGDFGLGGGSQVNFLKVTEICYSNRILTQVVYDTINIEDSTIIIGDALIKNLNLHEKWEDTALDGFYFSDTSFSTLSKQRALKLMLRLLAGNRTKGIPGILDVRSVDETGIMYVSINTKNEDLSMAIPKVLFKHLREYYDLGSIAQSQSTYKKLQDKSDSVRRAIFSNQKALLRAKDRSRGLVLEESNSRSEAIMVELQILGGMLGEIESNKETAEFIKESQSDYFKVLDSPFKPLTAVVPDYKKAALIGLLGGAFLSVVFFFALFFFKGAKD